MKRRLKGTGTLCECGDHAFATATKGYVFLVSPDDLALLEKPWYANARADGRIVIERKDALGVRLLAREILGNPDGKQVDHVNGRTLDNRRSNLRVCSAAENSQNRRSPKSGRSLPRGVHYRKRDGVYSVTIGAFGKRYWVGQFSTAEAARDAYAVAVKRLHGDFVRAA